MAIQKAHGPMAQFFGDKPNTGEYDNGVWQDIMQIPYIEKIEEAEYYDVVIRTLWLNGIGWGKAIKEKYPNTIQIGLVDHPLSTHISKMSSESQIAYIKDLSYVDGIMTLTEEEREWYSVAVPSVPVIKVGLPFPFETYEERYGSFRNQQRKYIGLGVGASDNDRNFISSAALFNRLKIDYPQLEGVFLSLPEQLIGQTAYLAETYPGIYLHQRDGMEEFYKMLSQCYFVINLADRNTPGRLQGEGAFFHTPVIGSNRLELQKELFPDFATSPYSLDQLYHIAVRLIEDKDVLKSSTEYAYNALKEYNYASSRLKLNELLNQIRAKREA